MKVYTALGDSITAGVGASSPTRAYPSVVASLLEKHSVEATVETFARPGWTSTDLRVALLQREFSPIRGATVTSIWIGGDNLIAAGLLFLQGAGAEAVQKQLSQYEYDLTAILRRVHRISRTSIVLCTQYNPFPNTPAAVQAIQALNEITQRLASQYRTQLAMTHQWFEGNQAELISGYRSGRVEDGAAGSFPVHPNDNGHLLIARRLLPLITRLRTASKTNHPSQG